MRPASSCRTWASRRRQRRAPGRALTLCTDSRSLTIFPHSAPRSASIPSAERGPRVLDPLLNKPPRPPFPAPGKRTMTAGRPSTMQPGMAATLLWVCCWKTGAVCRPKSTRTAAQVGQISIPPLLPSQFFLPLHPPSAALCGPQRAQGGGQDAGGLPDCCGQPARR